MDMMTNIVSDLLTLLKVKHSIYTVYKSYMINPYRGSFLGISQVLKKYGIKTIGLVIKKEDLMDYKKATPFVAKLGNNFAIIQKITETRLYFKMGVVNHSLPIEDFDKFWNGVLLLVDKSEHAEKMSQSFYFLSNFKIRLIMLFLFAGLVSVLLLDFTLDLLCYMLGLFFSFLLLVKEFKLFNSSLLDRICYVGRNVDCHKVMANSNSGWSKYIKLSEMGFAYFFTQILFMTCLKEFNNGSSFIAVLAIIIPVWSIYYQTVVIKSICVFCMFVQIVLISSFIINVMAYDELYLYNHNLLNSILLFALVFFVTIIVLAGLLQLVKVKNENLDLRYSLNKLMVSKNVVDCYYLDNKRDIDIKYGLLFGDTSSKVRITIVTSTLCEPCRKNSVVIQKLINENPLLCFQFILKSYSDDNEEINRLIISSYLSDENTCLLTIHKLYELSVMKQVDRLRSLEYNVDKHRVDHILSECKHVINNMSLNETPMIFINGRRLSVDYDLENISNIVKLQQ